MTAFEEKRARTQSMDSTATVDDVEFTISGKKGKYSGGINNEGKPHGNGQFVRDNSGTPLTYVGMWKDGERIATGEYYTNGRLLGNVVWD